MITKRDFSIKQFTLYLLLLLFLSSVQLIAQSNQTLEQRPGDASYKSAVGFHRQGLYKEALELYHKSLNDPTNQREGLSIVIEKNIAECEYGIRRKSTPEPVTVTKLASDVNRPNASNVNAFSGNKEQLIFITSIRPENDIKDSNGDILDQVYMAKRLNSSSQQWKVNLIGKRSSKRFHEGVLGTSPDGKEVFVFRGSGNIFVLDIDFQVEIDVENVGYVQLSKLYNIKWKNSYHISSMVINMKRTTIYLCMNDYGEEGGYGGYDIWRSSYDSSTKSWSKLVNMGPMINTEGDEVSVSLTPDERTLFFSSNGHRGVGKFDIFRSEFADSIGGTWGKPVNLGYPINTPNDDIYYNPVPGSPKKAYYSSERADGSGMYDICLITYYGRIVNDEERERLWKAYIKAIEEAKKATAAKERLAPKEEKLLAKKGYSAFPVDSVAVGMKIYLQNIQFANARTKLLPKSRKHLNQLYQLLLYYPHLSIEISGHTDNTGSKANNQRLSLKRAQSVAAYLLKKGIEKNRIKAKGYGDTQPIASNKTVDGRALNRRVEFKIIGIGVDEFVK